MSLINDRIEDEEATREEVVPAQEEEDSIQSTEEQKPKAQYFGRYGTFLLDVGSRALESGTVLIDSLEKSLRDDNRVTIIKPIKRRPEWMFNRRLYRDTRRSAAREPFNRKNTFYIYELSDPIVFCVSVPIRNQPKFRGADDVPSDKYWVAWDGITAVTLWPHEPETKIPRSGGHVVIDILRDVVRAAGYDLYEQACSPNCTNVFTHQVLHVAQYAGRDRITRIEQAGKGSLLINIDVSADGDVFEATRIIQEAISYDGQVFARYKNYARHIRDTETYARNRVGHLLSLNYREIEISKLKIYKRIAAKWVERGRRKDERSTIASLWLALAWIETVRRDWVQVRRLLDESTERTGTKVLFAFDKSDDETAITSQDLTFVKAAVEQSATRVDNRQVVFATALGALLGAGAAILGVFINAALQ